MKPVEFLTIAADNDYNTPAGEIQEALNKPLVIRSEVDNWKIFSYYYDKKAKRMVIDIEIKDAV